MKRQPREAWPYLMAKQNVLPATCPHYLQSLDGVHIKARISVSMISTPIGGPDKTYVTQGLQGLWAHSKGCFYHDGRFATLMDVVNHCNDCKKLNLAQTEKSDLVEYLKSL
jgi:hypothetical protein